MELFFENYYENVHENCMDAIQHQNYNMAKCIVDLLEPIFTFDVFESSVVGFTMTNGTRVSLEGYEYYMRYRFYPRLKAYLNQRKQRCEDIIQIFLHDERSEDYETVKTSVQKYFGITEDPRKLVEVKKHGNEITYAYESWIPILQTHSGECFDDKGDTYYTVADGTTEGRGDTYFVSLRRAAEGLCYLVSNNLLGGVARYLEGKREIEELGM